MVQWETPCCLKGWWLLRHCEEEPSFLLPPEGCYMGAGVWEGMALEPVLPMAGSEQLQALPAPGSSTDSARILHGTAGMTGTGKHFPLWCHSKFSCDNRSTGWPSAIANLCGDERNTIFCLWPYYKRLGLRNSCFSHISALDKSWATFVARPNKRCHFDLIHFSAQLC